MPEYMCEQAYVKIQCLRAVASLRVPVSLYCSVATNFTNLHVRLHMLSKSGHINWRCSVKSIQFSQITQHKFLLICMRATMLTEFASQVDACYWLNVRTEAKCYLHNVHSPVCSLHPLTIVKTVKATFCTAE